MKSRNWNISVVIAVCLMFTQSCATVTKTIPKDEIQKIPSIRLVRSESPNLLKPTAGSKAIAFTGIMFGAIGGGIGGGLAAATEIKNGKKLTEEFNLPDFGELVMNKFCEEITINKNVFPEINIVKEPVSKEYIDNSDDYILMIGFNSLRVANNEGLTASTVLKLIDPSNKVIAQQLFVYKGYKYKRCYKIKELEADNGKLLHEEYKYAADKTTHKLLSHLHIESKQKKFSGG